MYVPKEGLVDQLTFLVSLTKMKLKTVAKRNYGKYYNVPAAFDIEVSSFYDHNDKKVGVMYAWAFGINNMVCMGRTWEQYEELLKAAKRILGLNEEKKLPIYVHNLAYEFQFMRQIFSWTKVFSLDKSKPVYAQMGGELEGFEFRCSLKLSGKKLALLADDLTKYPVRKMVGDLDYSKIRFSTTNLTEKELKYIENDIRVVLHYIQEKIEIDGSIVKIPLTMTGYVRNYCRNECMANFESYYSKMKRLTLDPEEYMQLKRGFAGGFVHANALYVNEVLELVWSFDFTSSYPYVMLSEKFPMSKVHRPDRLLSEDEFEHCLHEYCCLFELELVGLKPRDVYDFPISKSKCYGIEGEIVNNGRVVEADWLCITVTEQDYFTIREFYEWEEKRVYNLKLYKKDYLPRAFALSILKLYKDKTTLKGVKGREIDYMLSKNKLNATYGMSVTDIARDEIIFDPYEDSALPPDLNSVIAKYNKSPRRFLFYPWGVWITAYARRNLFSAIKALGKDYVYSDTDSVKVLHGDKHMDYFDNYNKQVLVKLNLSAKHWHIDSSEFAPLNKKGTAKQLGIWDYEGTYDEFKTIGAKRYFVRVGNEYALTAAGVNKERACFYLLKLGFTNCISPFEYFNDELRVPEDYTGKNILTYINDEREGVMEDYLGNECYYDVKSCIHMEATDYNFSMSADFINFVKGVKEASW